jgi:hypothetical protein
MRFAELRLLGRSNTLSFDLRVGDSFDGHDSVDKAGEFGLICTEADESTNQMRTSCWFFRCPKEPTEF